MPTSGDSPWDESAFGGWSQDPATGSWSWDLPYAALLSCPWCSYHVSVLDESKTRPGCSILLHVFYLHLSTHVQLSEKLLHA